MTPSALRITPGKCNTLRRVKGDGQTIRERLSVIQQAGLTSKDTNGKVIRERVMR